MIIKFKKVRMKNFLGVGNYWQEIDLTKAKNTLVTGQNGAGKSAIILDSITYALFGRPNREVTLDLLINWITNKDSCVELEFDIGADQYKIVRGQKPAIFEIYKNGKSFKEEGLVKEEASKKDYQKTLEESILRMNLKTFKQVVIVGSATYQPLMQLEPKDRRAVVEDILDITVYSSMNVLATKKAKTLSLEIKSLDTEIGFRKEQEKTQRELIKSMEAEQKEREEEAESHIQEAKDEILANEQDIERAECDIVALDATYEQKTATVVEEYAAKITALEEELAAIEIPSASDVYRDKIRLLEDSRGKLSKQLGKFEATIETQQEQIKFYQQAECPTCGQEITEDHRHSMNENANGAITEAQSKLTRDEGSAGSVRRQDQETAHGIRHHRGRGIRVCREEARDQEQVIAERDRAVQMSGTRRSERVAALKAEIKQSEGYIAQWQNTIKQWSESVDSTALKKAKKEYKENSQLLATLNDTKAEKQDDLSYLEMSKMMLKDDGIKAQQIADDLPFINEKINEYLKKFELFLQFELTPTFDEVIKARYREKATYNSFSEGQKRRIDHSILFAFREIAMQKGSISCNIVAFDEILEKNLDDDGKDVLKELITLIDPDVHVFVISPIAFTEEFFDRKLTITYPNEFTKITEEMK
jgi:DNA repair exonuclease SbcCD ATPase subunit